MPSYYVCPFSTEFSTNLSFIHFFVCNFFVRLLEAVLCYMLYFILQKNCIICDPDSESLQLYFFVCVCFNKSSVMIEKSEEVL